MLNMLNACVGARAACPSIRTTRRRSGCARTAPRVVASQVGLCGEEAATVSTTQLYAATYRGCPRPSGC